MRRLTRFMSSGACIAEQLPACPHTHQCTHNLCAGKKVHTQVSHQEGDRRWKEEEWSGAGADPRAEPDTGVPGTSSPRWVTGPSRPAELDGYSCACIAWDWLAKRRFHPPRVHYRRPLCALLLLHCSGKVPETVEGREDWRD